MWVNDAGEGVIGKLSGLAAALLGAVLMVASPAVAATDGSPTRLWSVAAVHQGNGEVPVASGSQVGGELFQTAGPVGHRGLQPPSDVAVLGEPAARRRRSARVSSSANGSRYSVLAQAPDRPIRIDAGSPKGTITHLDEYQAYVKRADDASLRITISDLLLQNDRRQQPPRGVGVPARRQTASRCAPSCASTPARTRRRRAATSSTPAGSRTCEGHQHSWRPGAATSADSPRPLWGEAAVRRRRRRRRQRHGRVGRDGAQEVASACGSRSAPSAPASCSPCT